MSDFAKLRERAVQGQERAVRGQVLKYQFSLSTKKIESTKIQESRPASCLSAWRMSSREAQDARVGVT